VGCSSGSPIGIPNSRAALDNRLKTSLGVRRRSFCVVGNVMRAKSRASTASEMTLGVSARAARILNTTDEPRSWEPRSERVSQSARFAVNKSFPFALIGVSRLGWNQFGRDNPGMAEVHRGSMAENLTLWQSKIIPSEKRDIMNGIFRQLCAAAF
jgi:hypothetical protein